MGMNPLSVVDPTGSPACEAVQQNQSVGEEMAFVRTRMVRCSVVVDRGRATKALPDS